MASGYAGQAEIGNTLVASPGVSADVSVEIGVGEGQLLFHWLLLAQEEELDPCFMETDSEKAAFVQQHRCLGTALVREGSFEEAEKTYTNALDACRLHPLYKSFFPEEHGEMFRGVSSSAGVASYQPQLPKKPQNGDAWVYEAALACHSNLALCAMRQKKFRECIQHSGRVLAADSQNAKALFRRGVATASLGHDMKGALHDLEAAKVLQPADVSVQKELVRVKNAIKAAHKAEKAMFQGILS
jgi:tetratricopeptide (TPR) repeat protein